MDPSTYHDVWINLATNSPLVGFLIWNYWRNTKQLEEYRKEMKSDRDEYERKREEGIEQIRQRYMKVIEDLKEDKKGGIEDRLTSLEKGMKRLFSLMDKMKEQINELKIKEQLRNG